jgi:hypothetical protein
MHYRSVGRILDSELRLPSLSEIPASAVADIRVRFGQIPDADWNDPEPIQGWYRINGGLQFREKGIGSFRVDENGARLIVDVARDKRDEASAYVTGSALGAALHMAGEVVLHASAIATNRGAILFCGPSGAGKSTLAASLAARGYSLLSDDICALSVMNDRVLVQPDGRFLKLWQPAIEALGAEPARRDRVLGNQDKFHVSVGKTHALQLPIRALYELSWGAEGDPQSIVLGPAEAFATFFAHAYRPGLVAALHAQSTYFAAATTLCSNVPIRRLVRRPAFGELGSVVDLIEADINEAQDTRTL